MKAPKFVFNCKRTGMCCETRDSIDVFIDDIERWWNDGNFAKIFADMQVVTAGGPPIKLQIKKEGPCTFRENERCTIYETRPISCQAFPLGWNSKNFILVDEECPGIGKGTMTSEALEEIRNAAKVEYDARIRTAAILPALHAIILTATMKASEEAMSKLSDEDKEKLKKIFDSAK
ncbi:YkgJ family cysteine cluster protein [archaeon]|nr:YkgJ family cysteine cluster protein [archaeon]